MVMLGGILHLEACKEFYGQQWDGNGDNDHDVGDVGDDGGGDGVVKIDLKDNFHKRVKCVLLLLPGHKILFHQHGHFSLMVKPEVVSSCKVDFINCRIGKLFPAEESRGSPILRWKRKSNQIMKG